MSTIDISGRSKIDTKSCLEKKDDKYMSDEEAKVSDGLIVLKHGIFDYLKEKNAAEDRFKLSAQEYLDKYKVNAYLQDVVKFIIERKDERASDVLSN